MFSVFSARLIPQRCIVLSQNFASQKSGQKGGQQSGQAQAPKTDTIPEVKGFSDKVVNVPNYPVGFAGAAKEKEYKNPEYFCYHVDSFGDSMLELESYRLPAPSSRPKNKDLE